MVKKNLVNKNVVRALSIGLSLAMASQPLTAMAAGETSDTPTTDPVEGSPVAGPADDAKEEKPATQAAEVMGEAVDFKDTIKPVGDAIKETNDAIDAVNSANAQAPLQIELGVNKEAADLSWEADSNFNHISDVAEKDLALTGDLFGAAAQDFIKDNLESQVEDKVDARNKTLTNEEKTGVNDIVDKADELLDNTEETLTAAEQQLETSKDIIANTSDPAVAGPAYEAAKQKVEEANNAVNKAETDLAQLESDYAKAEEDFNDADEEYRTLKGQYENAYNAYISYVNAAGRDAQSLDRELERLEKEANDLYKAANAAKGRVDAAKAWVDQAKAATEAQKKALEKQKEELQKSKYAELKALEDKLNARVDDNYTTVNFLGKATEHNQENDPTFGDKTGVQKDTYDEYFDKVIELYYIPEVIKGKFVSLKWNKNNTNNDIYNYCDVTYQVVENGETVTKTVKLNYKLKESNDRHEFGGLVIFEKTEHFYFNQDELTEAERAEIEEKGGIDKGNYVVTKDAHGRYVKFADKVDRNAVTDSDNRVNGQGAGTVVEVDEDTKLVTWNYSNGKLTKTVTADVTTTTYTGTSLVAGVSGKSENAFANADAAKADFVSALRAKLGAPKANSNATETVIITNANGVVFEFTKGTEYSDADLLAAYVEDNDEATTGYKLYVSYNNKFTETVHIDGFKSSVPVFNEYVSDTEAKEAFNSAAAYKANEYKYRDGLFVDQQSTELLGYTKSNYSSREVGFEPHNVLGIKWDTNDGRYYSGDVTINYAKLSSMVVSKDWLVFTGINVNNESSSRLLAQRGYTGIKVVDTDQWDGEGLNKYTIYYYLDDANKEVVVSADSLEGINDASVLAALRDAGVTANNLNLSYNTSQAVAQTREGFGYKGFSFSVKSVLVEKAAEVEKLTWQKQNGNHSYATTTYENDKWYSGDISFATTYKHGEADYKTDANTEKRFTPQQQDLVIKYRNALKKQQDKIDAKDREIQNVQNKINDQDAESKRLANLSKLYAKISKEAKQAEKAADKAEKRIAEIKLMIDNLDRSRHDFEAELIEKKAWLEDAQQRLDAAIQRRDDLLDALKEITLPTGGGEGGGEPGGDEGTGTGDETPTIGGVLPAPVLLGGAPAGFIGGGGAPAAAGEGDGTVEITQPDTALAATAPEEKTEQPQLADIKTPDSPLAAAPINEETLSWWWLLIIAVLGGAGYAMYKKFQTKKDEKTTN